jgi:hypothetical protein
MKPLAAAAVAAAATLLLWLAVRRPSSNLAVLSGGGFAAAAWIWPAALGAAALLAAPLFDRRWPMRARLHLAASGLLGLGVVLAPWLLRRV